MRSKSVDLKDVKIQISIILSKQHLVYSFDPFLCQFFWNTVSAKRHA